MKPEKKLTDQLFIALGYALAIFVFVKNMWMSDDAYIMFRTIEQIFAGNGAVWNLGERVQVYTSVLWFWIIVAFSTLSSDLFIITNIVSFIFFMLTLFLVQKMLKSSLSFLFAVFLMTLSIGFFNFTSSGLENPLSYFLIALYVFNFNKIYYRSGNFHKNLIALIWIFGLLLLTRHDHSTLFFIPTLLIIIYNRKIYSWKKWLSISILALSPMILWTLFSLFYYGIPIPNTALAKLNTGISKSIVLYSGVKSYAAYVIMDFFTVIICVYGAILLYKTKNKLLRSFSYGIALNMIYVFYIGGDFMLGRFLSFAFFISLLMIFVYINDFDNMLKEVKNIKQGTKKSRASFAVIFLMMIYAVSYPGVPLFTSTDYTYKRSIGMVVEERGYYFEYSSIWKYIETQKSGEIFPDHNFSKEGKKLSSNADSIAIHGNIGYYGYHADLKNYIIDQWALSDPLLSRLNANPGQKYRTGHIGRDIPEGYIETIETGKPSFYDEGLNKFYEKLYLVVRDDDLFAWDRLNTIIEMNLGLYDHLLDQHNENVINNKYPAWD
jgi:arabinofuranosyltransferase